MLNKKTGRAKGEKLESEEKEEQKSIKETIPVKHKGNGKGRTKKYVSKEVKEKILKEVEEEIEKYKKTIERNDIEFLPYSSEDFSYLPNKFSKQLSKMIQVYIYKLNEDENNKYTNEINFGKKFKKIISRLNMNENDFAYFTLILEKIGWDCDKKYQIFEHLHYIAILVMQFSSDKYQNNITKTFDNWKRENKIQEDDLKNISIKEINDRKEELISDYDEFDPDKYLDFNQMVDDIIMKTRIYQ